MKTLWLGPLLLVLMVTSVVAETLPRPDQLEFPPLEIEFPEIARTKLDNGMRLYVKEDDELPLVNITLMIEGGSIHDPVDQTGLAELFAQTLETGGAGDMSPQQLEETLDRLAAQLSVASSSYAYQIDLSVHQQDLDLGLDLLAALLRRPAFDPERLELARARLLEGIHRRNDNPSSIAGRYLARAVNPGHPFGSEATVATVSGLTRDELLALHQRFFHPSRIWWGVSGAVDASHLKARLEELFGDWQTSPTADVEMPPLPPEPGAQVFVIDRELPQTTVLMGHRGISKDAPDFMALRVANYIFGGGGFNSRLMREIRSNRGLVYSIYSQVQLGRILPELFVIGGETRNDTAVEMVVSVTEMLEELVTTGVTDSELELAQNSLVNSFIFAFENTHAVVTQNLRLDYYDYPGDYLQTYQQQIRALTAADIQQAAQNYLHPDRLQIVLVGDAKVLLPELSKQGFAAVVLVNLDEPDTL